MSGITESDCVVLQSLKCHSRQTSDFVYVGSSSLLAAAGHSSDNQNVGLWDTLLPQHSALVQGRLNFNDLMLHIHINTKLKNVLIYCAAISYYLRLNPVVKRQHPTQPTLEK